MISTTFTRAFLLLILALGLPAALAAPKKVAPEIPLNESGKRAEARYESSLTGLRADLTKTLPTIPEELRTKLQQAQAAVKAAEAQVAAARQPVDAVKSGEGLVAHAKGKWIGGADKGIAAAQAALKKATTDAEREAASKDLAKWQANREDGLKALKERQAALDQARLDQPRAIKVLEAAQANLTTAREQERAAVMALLAVAEPVLTNDRLDPLLVKAAILSHATPRGLAVFAQQGAEHEALIETLLADPVLMKEMLIAGGASGGQYGRAMEIYTAIRRASPKSAQGELHRLALATSLEHAVPIGQSNNASQTDGPATVDPVLRYMHYEKAYLDGELDAAFKHFSTWEYRMVVDSDAPDAILTWGRQMLRIYRPDHISNPDYGWRYSGAVRTEVRYGSQHVQDDLPELNKYQNIPRNGGVCGRRAFFGRFILKSFGIPTWGVTQHKHAALSHWTPKGWVVNLGAGFPHSWWDKGDVARSGSDFLLETQARNNAAGYVKVLRAQWISRILGEEAYNDRRKIAGGLWSNLAQSQAIMLAADTVALGPLGQELGEANESPERTISAQAPAPVAQTDSVTVRNGAVVFAAAAVGSRSTGPSAVMNSFAGGLQIHASGGFKTQYAVTVPQSGKYALTAQVATLQAGQVLLFKINDAAAPMEMPVPYTVGLWQQTQPLEVSLVSGNNTLHFEIKSGSRGVTIKDFTLTPVK